MVTFLGGGAGGYLTVDAFATATGTYGTGGTDLVVVLATGATVVLGGGTEGRGTIAGAGTGWGAMVAGLGTGLGTVAEVGATTFAGGA